MKKVYVNEEWCLGCHLCEFYCAAGAGGDVMVNAFAGGIPPVSRIKVEECEDTKVNFAVQCRHCIPDDDTAPDCVRGCITGALQISYDGDNRVIVCDETRCVGCYTCVLSCPYGCIVPDDNNHIIKKCDLCISRSAGNPVPACVAGCPNAAIVYEDVPENEKGVA